MSGLALTAAFVALTVLTAAVPLGHAANRELIPRQRWRYWAHRAGILRSPVCTFRGVPFGPARARRRRAQERAVDNPFVVGFRLHGRHGLVLDGALLPCGYCLVVECAEDGLITAARSLEDLVRGYPDAYIEWPAHVPEEGPGT
ncbi:hypothetical protein [Streptomyces sp. NPDC053541]|uniref:hypothetical protein n=1 Tax=Streptomyces sp. NPDC053541 TaxID=3365709 RepID=UPI0037D0E639